MASTLARLSARRTTRHRTSAWASSWCQVKDLRLSTRVTESPACLVTNAFGITPALASMYRASGQAVPVGNRILERNPKHHLVTRACFRRRRLEEVLRFCRSASLHLIWRH